jgi:biopolymer transport protein TolQ
MDTSLVTQAPLGTAAAAHDFSVWALFLSADWIVKLVMLLLLAASVWCWGIIFEKIVTLRRLNARAADFEDSFWSGGSLEALYEKIAKRSGDPMAATFAAGMREWRHASDRGLADAGSVRAGLQQRVDRIMTVTIGRELARAERSMTLLATVGSTAPFVGLFGTVWGIINAFTAIASENNTSLAVVAPGIAEALFTTALGLVAAIPAVIAYNKFSNEIGRYADRLDAFAGDFSTILSRHLEERA